MENKIAKLLVYKALADKANADLDKKISDLRSDLKAWEAELQKFEEFLKSMLK